MKKIFLLGTLISTCLIAYAQSKTDNSSLIKEASGKLSNRSATVSEILTDKKYLAVHPDTEFRDLIKNNSNSSILAISTSDEPGKKIKVLCTIADGQGKAISDALVYLYQTDYRGWYAAEAPHVLSNEGDMGHARLFGYVKTDAAGKFELHTVKPSGYPQSDLPAHIHVHVWKAGYSPFVTEFLFDNDERLVGSIREQAVQSRFLVAMPQETAPPFSEQFSYNIVLGK